jgi:predicted DCC family thiol-disulfide oxidoreductase YuxK
MTNPPVLLYDGVCGFCNRTVHFVLAHDPVGTMRFAPLDGEFARDILQRHPELQGADSVVLVHPATGGMPERVSTRSDAMLKVANYLGGPWRVAAALRILPRGLRDWGYDLFARWRYRLFGRFDSCPIPAPDVRDRFVT